MENPYASPATLANKRGMSFPRMHIVFVILFCIWTTIPILLAFGSVGNFTGIGVGIQTLGLSWLAGIPFLFCRSRLGMVVIALAIGSAWILGVLQTARRVYAILSGTMEGPDGEGSPMAFLVNLILEQLFWVVPTSCLLLYFAWYLYWLRQR